MRQPASKPVGYSGYAWNDGRRNSTPNYVAWLRTIFPQLPAPPRRVIAMPDPEQSNWPEEAIELSKSLLRDSWLEKLEGGLEIPNDAGTDGTLIASAAAVVRLDLP